MIDVGILGSQKFGVSITTDWCGSVGIQLDRGRFSQIIDNLINNAFKVTPRGKNITVKTDLIDDFKRDNKSLRIQIIDEGPGIPRNKIAEIFDKYTQIDTNQSGAPTGIGLGLSIVAQFVRLHNGEINVDGGGENTGRGANFSLHFPNASILSTESVRQTAKGLSKVLIVDDDEDILGTIIDALREMPLDIRTAADGVEAFAMFLTWDPDLVISDVKMPEKNGIELLNDIKHSSPGTPVILLSGALEDFGEGDIQTTLKPEAYLAKPFVSADLIATVETLLKQD